MRNERKHEGKVALVLGGSRGIGAAIVARLAADGAKLALTYSTSPDRAEALVAQITQDGGRGDRLAGRQRRGKPGQGGH